MSKEQREFHQPHGEWRRGMVDGMTELILSQDPDTRDYTRLVVMAPGTDTTEAGVLMHDFHEEVFIVAGDLTDLTLGETFTAGMYACRLPGMPHGPYRSDSGCRMVEMRYNFT